MPIDKEWSTLYPSNWKQISLAIREQAGQCCEWCKVPNNTTVIRMDNSGFWTIGDPDIEDFEDLTWFNEEGEQCSAPEDLEAYFWLDEDEWNVREVPIVLTVAHLDQDPRNCEESNLVALCQRCHIKYDKQPQQRKIRERLRAELLAGQQTLGFT